MQKLTTRPLVLVALIGIAAFSRIVPHMPNFSPLGAISLFAAAHFRGRLKAFVVPLAATWLSDLFLNNIVYALPGGAFAWGYAGMFWQYGAYALIASLGLWLFRTGYDWPRVVAGALGSGLVFFLVSNFGVWWRGTMYAPGIEGLTAAYTAALPFYQGTLMGDVFYVAVLFGGLHLLQKLEPRLRHAPAS